MGGRGRAQRPSRWPDREFATEVDPMGLIGLLVVLILIILLLRLI